MRVSHKEVRSNDRSAMPLNVVFDALVASPELILTGPICVYCKSKFAVDRAGGRFSRKTMLILFVCRGLPGLSRPLCNRFFS